MLDTYLLWVLGSAGGAAVAVAFWRVWKDLRDFREIREMRKRRDHESQFVINECADWGLFLGGVYTDASGEQWVCTEFTLVEKYLSPIGHMLRLADWIDACDSGIGLQYYAHSYYLPELGLIHKSDGETRHLKTDDAPGVDWDDISPDEARRLWCIALRSGAWLQGTGTLRSYDRFCCLGLGCDIIAPNGWTSSSTRGNLGCHAYKGLNTTTALNERFTKMYGLYTHCATLRSAPEELEEEYVASLMDANDDFKWDFNRIADFIETYPEYITKPCTAKCELGEELSV